MQFKVDAHTVHVTRRNAKWFARIIELHADSSCTSDILRAIVYFYGTEIDWPMDDIGYQLPLPDRRGYIVAMLPLVDFRDHCRLLQGNRPVYLTWEAEERDQRLRSLYLSTDSNEVGHGIRDYEPPRYPRRPSEG